MQTISRANMFVFVPMFIDLPKFRLQKGSWVVLEKIEAVGHRQMVEFDVQALVPEIA